MTIIKNCPPSCRLYLLLGAFLFSSAPPLSSSFQLPSYSQGITGNARSKRLAALYLYRRTVTLSPCGRCQHFGSGRKHLGIGRSQSLPYLPSQSHFSLNNANVADTVGSEDWEDEDEEDQEDEEEEISPKELARRQTYGKYGFVSMLFLLAGVKAYSRFLPQMFGVENTAGMMMGPFLVVFLCRILMNATKHDRLGSDTYRRLNAILMGYTILSQPDHHYSLVGANLFGFFAGWDGFEQGTYGTTDRKVGKLRGVAETFGSLFRELKVTLKGMTSAKNRTSAVYLVIAIVMALGNVLNNIPFLGYALDQQDPFMVKLCVNSVARMWLVSGLFYTLKDASDRGRLGGATFVQLNWLVAAWASVGSIVSYISAVGPSEYILCGALAPVAAFCAKNAYTYGRGSTKAAN